MDIVTVNSLIKKYKTTLALKDISIKLSDGRIYGLIGNNGAGKTTLIKSILGLIKPTNGEIYVFNEKAYQMSNSCKKKLGVAYDKPMFVPNMSALDNLLYFCSDYGVRSEELKKRYDEYSCKLNLKNAEQNVGEYSMGMKQKLSIIRSLITYPQILILDEPFNGLDPSTRIALSKILQDFNNKTGATILISSHNVDMLEAVADEFIYLKNGNLAAFGDIKTVTDTIPQLGHYKIVIPSHLLEESVRRIKALGTLKIVDQSKNTLIINKNEKADCNVFEIIAELNLPVDEVKRVDYGLESIFSYENLNDMSGKN